MFLIYFQVWCGLDEEQAKNVPLSYLGCQGLLDKVRMTPMVAIIDDYST